MSDQEALDCVLKAPNNQNIQSSTHSDGSSNTESEYVGCRLSTGSTHAPGLSTAMSGDVELLVGGLRELQAAKYDTQPNILASCHQTGRVLDLIYDLGVEKTKLPIENKAVIGPLLESSLKSIEINVKRTAVKYRRRLDTEVLRKRSALQFLIDDFGDCPTKTPEKNFSIFFPDINELVEILDDLISKWKGLEDPDDPLSDLDEADDLPASHTWWKH